MTAQNILDAIASQKSSLRDFGVIRVGLFGSTARGDDSETSDIDLLVEFDPEKKTYRNYYNTSTLMESVLKRSIDILTPQSLSPYIKPHILKDIRYVEIAN